MSAEDTLTDVLDAPEPRPGIPQFRAWFHTRPHNYSPHGPYTAYEMPVPRAGRTFIVRVEGERFWAGTIEGPGLNDRFGRETQTFEDYMREAELVRTDENEVAEGEVDLIYQAYLASVEATIIEPE